MENIQLILSIAGTALGLLITTITFLTKLIQNAKAKKAMENIVKMGNEILPYMEEAEKLVSKSGFEKKAYVMEKAREFALENEIAFDAQAISGKIEELIELTKEVNKNKE